MPGVSSGEYAGLAAPARQTLDLVRAASVADVAGDFGRLLGDGNLSGHWMFRGHGQERDAVQRVGTAGECGYRLFSHREHDFGSFGATNPATLHSLDAFGPVNRIQVVQKPLGKVGYAEVPLFQFLACYHRIAAPAAAVFDLLIGQDRPAVRAPPLAAPGPVCQPATEQQQKEPLRPAIVSRVGRVDFARPVIRAFDQLHLAAVVGYEPGRCLARMDTVGDGIVFRRQPEGIPAHWMQHVETAHAMKTGADTGRNVVAAMTHRQTIARWIGKVVQYVDVGFVRVVGGSIELIGLPARPPPGLDSVEIIASGRPQTGSCFSGHLNTPLGIRSSWRTIPAADPWSHETERQKKPQVYLRPLRQLFSSC